MKLRSRRIAWMLFLLILILPVVVTQIEGGISTNTLYAHAETTTIGGSSYYLHKISSADNLGTTLSQSAATTGRKLMGRWVYSLNGIISIPASTWTITYRAMRSASASLVVAHCDVDILIRKADGTVRSTIATNIANSPTISLVNTWQTLTGTYNWAVYTVVDQTDYLEVACYIEVTTSQSSKSVRLLVDDGMLPLADQTKIENVAFTYPATIWTDKAEYEYYETASIFGSGFEALANVTVTIVRPDGASDTVCAVTDNVGNFTCTYQLNGIPGTYTVTATDGTNTATTTFLEGAITPELYGYTLEPSPGWTHGDVKGYYECEWVPYKIEVTSSKKGSYQLTVIVHHDHNDSTWLGLDDVKNWMMWRNGVSETPTISGLVNDGWESGIQQLQWSWTFTINEDDNCTLMFETHVAIGAHNYPGSKVHTHIHDITSVPFTPISAGHRDVPIVVKGPPPGADVAIQKTGVVYAHEGDTIAYQFNVTNYGPGTALNVHVTDDLLGDLTGYLPDTTLLAGEVNTFSVNCVVPSPCGDITDTVTVTSTTSDPNSSNNVASWTVDVLHTGIDVSKSGPNYAHEKDTLTFTITVKNTGDCPLSNVVVSDDLLGLIYSDGLAVGETKTFIVTYTVPTPSGDVKNTVTASGEDALGLKVTDTASWTVDVLHPAIKVTKTADKAKAYAGETITYTITVTNTGDCILYDVGVTDTLLGPIWSGTLNVGESKTFTLTYTVGVGDPDPLRNTVTASGKDILGLLVTDEATAEVDLIAKICGYKFRDENMNGVWDVGEPPVEGIKIELWLAGSKIKEATTGPDGKYCFDELNAGTYILKEVLPANWVNTTLSSLSVTIRSGEVSEGNNFGNKEIEPLSVLIDPTTAKIKVGESVSFTSSVSGGKPPYTSYQWYLNGVAVSGATSPTWTFTPTSTGTYTVYLNVTDSVPQTAKSNEASVTVAPPLTVSISPMETSILVGQSVTFTSTVSGGYPSYNYQWYLGGVPVSGATLSSWTFTPTTSGIYYVYLKVTDANQNTAQSQTARIEVSEPPVGGYSISLARKTPTLHIAIYTLLIAFFSTALSLTKRKRK